MFDNKNERYRESIISMLMFIQEQEKRYDLLQRTNGAKAESTIKRVIACLNPAKFKSVRGFLLDKYSQLMIRLNTKRIKNNEITAEYNENEYFSNEKIVVYTSIFGNYDSIHEPGIAPDNIDYYIVTDCSIDSNSRWKVRNVELPSGLNAAQKNRYVKMHPHLVFPEYKYSIYVDGNISIISDLTPLIYRIGKYGFAMHKHSSREDVFDELKAAYYTKRVTKQKYTQYTCFLKKRKMPRDYGLVECNVIARNHENNISAEIMDQWWNEYFNGINRDQICLAYILFKNEIRMSDVGTLGSNVYGSKLLKVYKHV